MSFKIEGKKYMHQFFICDHQLFGNIPNSAQCSASDWCTRKDALTQHTICIAKKIFADKFSLKNKMGVCLKMGVNNASTHIDSSPLNPSYTILKSFKGEK